MDDAHQHPRTCLNPFDPNTLHLPGHRGGGRRGFQRGGRRSHGAVLDTTKCTARLSSDRHTARTAGLLAVLKHLYSSDCCRKNVRRNLWKFGKSNTMAMTPWKVMTLNSSNTGSRKSSAAPITWACSGHLGLPTQELPVDAVHRMLPSALT